MIKGIDVSENNGVVDFEAVKNSGYDFVIVRLGYGNRHLDSMFYRNINEAIAAGLKVGVYYYDYGLTEEMADTEAEFTKFVLQDCGLTPELLEMGVWFDMEDADEWKANHGFPMAQTITDMCNVFVGKLRSAGYKTGVYASMSWFYNYILTEQLDTHALWWVAQWADSCDLEDDATIWQYSADEWIDGKVFDANELLKEL